jgi:hypothetical protein
VLSRTLASKSGQAAIRRAARASRPCGGLGLVGAYARVDGSEIEREVALC